MRDRGVALTLQNGVESVDEVAASVGAPRVLGGSTYVATALSAPGLIEQTGTHRRVVFGEVSGDTSRVSDRVQQIGDAFSGADIVCEPVADARVPIWEKFCYLAPFGAFTGAARVPIGPLWADAAGRSFEQQAAALAPADPAMPELELHTRGREPPQPRTQQRRRFHRFGKHPAA